MCSIFGFIARPGRQPDIKILSAIVAGNIHRGPHAFGFAWIDERGRLRSYRQAGRLTSRLALLRMLRGARMLVGHLRWATQGTPADNINNHPHPCDGGWLVHNGVVHNYEDLASRRRVNLSSECDTEAIAQWIEKSSESTLAGRCAAAAEAVDGPLAMLGLWARPASIVAVRRGNPLHVATTGDGLYLATLGTGLPGEIKRLRDNRASILRVRAGKIESVNRDLVPRISPTRAGSLFDRCAAGQYRGG